MCMPSGLPAKPSATAPSSRGDDARPWVHDRWSPSQSSTTVRKVRRPGVGGEGLAHEEVGRRARRGQMRAPARNSWPTSFGRGGAPKRVGHGFSGRSDVRAVGRQARWGRARRRPPRARRGRPAGELGVLEEARLGLRGFERRDARRRRGPADSGRRRRSSAPARRRRSRRCVADTRAARHSGRARPCRPPGRGRGSSRARRRWRCAGSVTSSTSAVTLRGGCGSGRRGHRAR
jgi:hypothetical protein